MLAGEHDTTDSVADLSDDSSLLTRTSSQEEMVEKSGDDYHSVGHDEEIEPCSTNEESAPLTQLPRSDGESNAPISRELDSEGGTGSEPHGESQSEIASEFQGHFQLELNEELDQELKADIEKQLSIDAIDKEVGESPEPSDLNTRTCILDSPRDKIPSDLTTASPNMAKEEEVQDAIEKEYVDSISSEISVDNKVGAEWSAESTAIEVEPEPVDAPTVSSTEDGEGQHYLTEEAEEEILEEADSLMNEIFSSIPSHVRFLSVIEEEYDPDADPLEENDENYRRTQGYVVKEFDDDDELFFEPDHRRRRNDGLTYRQGCCIVVEEMESGELEEDFVEGEEPVQFRIVVELYEDGDDDVDDDVDDDELFPWQNFSRQMPEGKLDETLSSEENIADVSEFWVRKRRSVSTEDSMSLLERLSNEQNGNSSFSTSDSSRIPRPNFLDLDANKTDASFLPPQPPRSLGIIDKVVLVPAIHNLLENTEQIYNDAKVCCHLLCPPNCLVHFIH